MSCKVSTCIDLILFRGGVVNAYIVPVFMFVESGKKKQNMYKYVCYSEFDIGPISNFAVAANFILS